MGSVRAVSKRDDREDQHEEIKLCFLPTIPWIVVEGNDKYYARIKVLECVTEAIEKRLKEERK